MADERAAVPADTIAVGFQALVEGLRNDVREDIRDLRTEVGRSEERVTARVEAVASDQRETRVILESFAKGHADEHEAEAEDRRVAHGTFYEFIRKFELDQARRDGALGVVRFTIELLSRNAPRLIAIIASIATVIGFATGGISIQVGS